MRFVKCDKCGTTVNIGLIDSDYGCYEDDGEEFISYDDDRYVNVYEINGKKYDICNKCYKELQFAKEEAEKKFIESIEKNRNKEQQNDEHQ